MKGKPGEITRLSELQEEIRSVLSENLARPRWIVAEISELKENFSGHCYLDLVEKDDDSDKLLARARATIWSSAYRMLKPYFETTTGYELSTGIKIMVSASVEYHPVYGLSLNIKDIDPNYTLGDVERKRQEIINRLSAEGVINMNKETILPAVSQKIAVISSKTAAGYEDFLEQLGNNQFGYKFYTKLYPSAMQGEKAEESIIGCLEKIFEYEDFFDIVIIIRGGGSKSDLACFDSYDLAFHVSQFPLPVLTGIGHEQDETIIDLVAHTRFKTPTAVAGFLIDQSAGFESLLDEYGESLIRGIQAILNERKLQLQISRQQLISGSREFVSAGSEKLLRFISRSRILIRNSIGEHSIRIYRMGERLRQNARIIPERRATELDNYWIRFRQLVRTLLETERNRLNNFRKLLSYAEPDQILKLGFSITRYRGNAIKDSTQLKQDDVIDTEFSTGKIISKVTDIEKKLYIRKSKERSS